MCLSVLNYIFNEKMQTGCLYRTLTVYQNLKINNNLISRYARTFDNIAHHKYLKLENRDLVDLLNKIHQVQNECYLFNTTDSQNNITQECELGGKWQQHMQQFLTAPYDFEKIYQYLEILHYKISYGFVNDDNCQIQFQEDVYSVEKSGVKLFGSLQCQQKRQINLKLSHTFSLNDIQQEDCRQLFANIENRIQKVLVMDDNTSGFSIIFNRQTKHTVVNSNFNELAEDVENILKSGLGKYDVVLQTRFMPCSCISSLLMRYLQYVNFGYMYHSLELLHPQFLQSLTITNVKISNLSSCINLRCLWSSNNDLFSEDLKCLDKLRVFSSHNDTFIGNNELHTFIDFLNYIKQDHFMLPLLDWLEISDMSNFQGGNSVMQRKFSYFSVKFSSNDKNLILFNGSAAPEFLNVKNGIAIIQDSFDTGKPITKTSQKSFQNIIQDQRDFVFLTSYLEQNSQFGVLKHLADLQQQNQRKILQQVRQVIEIQDSINHNQEGRIDSYDYYSLFIKNLLDEFFYGSKNQNLYQQRYLQLQYLQKRLLVANVLRNPNETFQNLFGQKNMEFIYNQQFINFLVVLKRFMTFVWTDTEVLDMQFRLLRNEHLKTVDLSSIIESQLNKIEDRHLVAILSGLQDSAQMLNLPNYDFTVFHQIKSKNISKAFGQETLSLVEQVQYFDDQAGQCTNSSGFIYDFLFSASQTCFQRINQIKIRFLHLRRVQINLDYPEQLLGMFVDEAKVQNLDQCVNLCSLASKNNIYSYLEVKNLFKLRYLYSVDDFYTGVDGSGNSCMLKQIMLRTKLSHVCVIRGQNIASPGVYRKNLEDLVFFYVETVKNEETNDNFDDLRLNNTLKMLQIIQKDQAVKDITDSLTGTLLSQISRKNSNFHFIFPWKDEYNAIKYSKLKVAVIEVYGRQSVPNLWVLRTL